MPVAKSYADCKVVREPYEKDGKMYCDILKSNRVKTVRWYSVKEFNKLYPECAVKECFNARRAFEFGDEGFIYVLRGKDEEIRKFCIEDNFRLARMNTIFGWYIPAHMAENVKLLPAKIKFYKIPWELISTSETEIIEDYDIVRKKIFEFIVNMRTN